MRQDSLIKTLIVVNQNISQNHHFFHFALVQQKLKPASLKLGFLATKETDKYDIYEKKPWTNLSHFVFIQV